MEQFSLFLVFAGILVYVRRRVSQPKTITLRPATVREAGCRTCSKSGGEQTWRAAIEPGEGKGVIQDCFSARYSISIEASAGERSVALDRAGIMTFRGFTFLAAGPASERSRSALEGMVYGEIARYQ